MPIDVVHDIGFNAWSESQVATNISQAYDNQTFRAYVGLDGDYDGLATYDESRDAPHVARSSTP